MKKFLFFIVLLVVMALVLIATCPDREAHRTAIKDVVAGVVNSEMNNQSLNEALASIGTAVAISTADAYLNSSLMIRDHTFYNVGVIDYDGEFRMVSVGVLNHVFTISEDDARELIKDKLPSLKGL
jgi:hypothetical protein